MAKTETEIKGLVRAAQAYVMAKTPNVDFVNPRHLYIRWMDIQVELIAHSVFSKSFYRVSHPLHGKWEGMLNDYSGNYGTFGVLPGKPKRIA